MSAGIRTAGWLVAAPRQPAASARGLAELSSRARPAAAGRGLPRLRRRRRGAARARAHPRAAAGRRAGGRPAGRRPGAGRLRAGRGPGGVAGPGGLLVHAADHPARAGWSRRTCSAPCSGSPRCRPTRDRWPAPRRWAGPMPGSGAPASAPRARRSGPTSPRSGWCWPSTGGWGASTWPGWPATTTPRPGPAIDWAARLRRIPTAVGAALVLIPATVLACWPGAWSAPLRSLGPLLAAVGWGQPAPAVNPVAAPAGGHAGADRRPAGARRGPRRAAPGAGPAPPRWRGVGSGDALAAGRAAPPAAGGRRPGAAAPRALAAGPGAGAAGAARRPGAAGAGRAGLALPEAGGGQPARAVSWSTPGCGPRPPPSRSAPRRGASRSAAPPARRGGAGRGRTAGRRSAACWTSWRGTPCRGRGSSGSAWPRGPCSATGRPGWSAPTSSTPPAWTRPTSPWWPATGRARRSCETWTAFDTDRPASGLFLDEVALVLVYARPGAWR